MMTLHIVLSLPVIVICLSSMFEEKDHVLPLNLETNTFNKVLVAEGVNR